MSYVKTVWKDRLVEKPMTFKANSNLDGTITLERVEGTITEAGIPINAANMNKIENTLESQDNIIGNAITKTGTETLTNKTLTSPIITNPKINGIGAIADENGNEQIKFETTANAVNEITVKNNISSQAPQIKASGSDTNIDVNLIPKGTGRLKENGVNVVNANELTVALSSLSADMKSLNGKYDSVLVGSFNYAENIGDLSIQSTDIMNLSSYTSATTFFNQIVTKVAMSKIILKTQVDPSVISSITLLNSSGQQIGTFTVDSNTGNYSIDYNFNINTVYSIQIVTISTQSLGYTYSGTPSSTAVTYNSNVFGISSITYYVKQTNLVKTYNVLANAKKWGMLTFEKTIPNNTSLVVDILDNAGTVLYSNISSPFDLSSIDISNVNNKTLKIRVTASRTNTSVNTTILKNMVVTFEDTNDPKRITQGTILNLVTQVNPNSTYIKTIPLGVCAKSGKLYIDSSGYNSITKMVVSFDDNYNNTVSISYNGDYASSLRFGTGTNLNGEFSLDGGNANLISISKIYIENANLKIEFYNRGSDYSSVRIGSLRWEVYN